MHVCALCTPLFLICEVHALCHAYNWIECELVGITMLCMRTSARDFLLPEACSRARREFCDQEKGNNRLVGWNLPQRLSHHKSISVHGDERFG
jgi:hypothetical protein